MGKYGKLSLLSLLIWSTVRTDLIIVNISMSEGELVHLHGCHIYFSSNQQKQDPGIVVSIWDINFSRDFGFVLLYDNELTSKIEQSTELLLHREKTPVTS